MPKRGKNKEEDTTLNNNKKTQNQFHQFPYYYLQGTQKERNNNDLQILFALQLPQEYLECTPPAHTPSPPKHDDNSRRLS
jgi:hypothetical protein